jgi:hypothetical protein
MKLKEKIKRLSEQGDDVQRLLSDIWLDADNGDWPKQNCGQRKALVEHALDNYKGED